MTRREECKALLQQALQQPVGLTFKVESGRKGARTLALAALAAAKRELSLDVKEVLDLVFKIVPGTSDEIAIIRLSPKEEEDE